MRNNTSPEDLISADAAAALRGWTAQHVRGLARRGLLAAVRVGASWVFRRGDVLAYRPDPIGRPRKTAAG
jgi:hypothetical protein